jgi:hypothetical protein
VGWFVGGNSEGSNCADWVSVSDWLQGVGGKARAHAADLDFAASMEPWKSWPSLPSPVGKFIDVRMVSEPPERGGSFDLVFEPPGLFVVFAIDAEEVRIGPLEEFFRTALVPALLGARERDEEGTITRVVRFQMEAVPHRKIQVSDLRIAATRILACQPPVDRFFWTARFAFRHSHSGIVLGSAHSLAGVGFCGREFPQPVGL